MITGKSLVGGTWKDGEGTFTSAPVTGEAQTFSKGTPALVAEAAAAAEAAFPFYAATLRQTRAAFLNAIADEIEARAEEITAIGAAETGLPEARLQGERGRTTGQLRLFAEHILHGDYLDRRHDAAMPNRQPLPRPDLKVVQRPIGPVAVFGASNFPLAFSTAGGDTASALAAGCPVVVKGHPAHPGTGEIVAQAINAAREKEQLPAGVFSYINDGGNEVGAALVQAPQIKAVGFTGSLRGGRALFNLATARPEPIPFFGELGSINPVFVLHAALAARSAEIAQGWVGSLSLGAGQFCTNPGVVVAIEGAETDAFVAAASEAAANVGPQKMLTPHMADVFAKGRDQIKGAADVDTILAKDAGPREAAPNVFRTTGAAFLSSEHLAKEVFGPLGLIVAVKDEDEMIAVAQSLEGQLTATLQMDDADMDLAQRLTPVLEQKAGRILANGFPTGVEVADAMVHSGPYPASTNFGATSVGTLAIRRFLRPVCYQNMPDALVPEF
ncbi:MAG: aldehyde dehydrogenase (NADP(+)) [Silicimonas sp.]|nr:aldehyde dehydrogenase (NADP(+)) [Silicimonas sp.]